MRVKWISCVLIAAMAIAIPARSAQKLTVTPDLERAVRRGLAFLAKTQNPSGSWTDRSTAAAGLAIIAFLAHGELPDEGEYGHVIRRAVNYILSCQKSNGLLAHGGSMYEHGFATLALGEVYGVIDDERVGPALKRATDLIIAAQNSLGGWRYSVGSTDADTTVSGAQMVALRAAANAGMEVPLTTIRRGAAFYKSCFCPGGGFGYTGPGGPNQPRAGIGLLVLSLSGAYRSVEAKATADWLFTHGFGGKGYFYYKSYYCSQAMFQAGGKYWQHWNSIMTPLIISMQQPNGSWKGTRVTVDTAFALLALEVNYNYLPIYQR